MELVVPELVNIIAIIAMIAGLLFAGWWFVGLYGMRTRKSEQELPEVDLPAHLHEALTGVPPFLIIFYAFVAVCLVAYVLSVWAFGVTY